jgi:hypothetical protein
MPFGECLTCHATCEYVLVPGGGGHLRWMDGSEEPWPYGSKPAICPACRAELEAGRRERAAAFKAALAAGPEAVAEYVRRMAEGEGEPP